MQRLLFLAFLLIAFVAVSTLATEMYTGVGPPTNTQQEIRMFINVDQEAVTGNVQSSINQTAIRQETIYDGAAKQMLNYEVADITGTHYGPGQEMRSQDITLTTLSQPGAANVDSRGSPSQFVSIIVNQIVGYNPFNQRA